MKFLTILAAASTLCLAQSGFAFTAVTQTAAETNAKGAGNVLPGAQVGDTFNVVIGSFASYTPGAGDPLVTGGDLGTYHFSMSGTVTAVNGVNVSYAGFYSIYYDTDHNNGFDAGDTIVSAGTLTLGVDFGGAGPNYVANGTLMQTEGPTGPNASSFTGFANGDANFSGIYTQNLTDPLKGSVQGTISSPDSGTTLGLLGISAAALLAMKRRVSIA